MNTATSLMQGHNWSEAYQVRSRKDRFAIRYARANPLKHPHFAPAQFLAALEDALRSISEEVLYRDERAFQGALLHELNARLGHGVLPEDPVIQQEYQKHLRHHGIKIRPDIIVHIPFERGGMDARDEGNFVAIELKRRATTKRARHAFASLAKMKRALKYPLTVFINVVSEETLAALCPKSIAGQTVCFATRLEEGKPILKAERRAIRLETRVASD
jgi:hypothetical protein